MAKKIQTVTSDKNYDDIMRIVNNGEIERYDGSVGASLSSVSAYLIDLGLKVYLSSKQRNKFDLDGYREEMLRLNLKNNVLSEIILSSLSKVEPFGSNHTNLVDEKFYTEEVKQKIDERVERFFESNGSQKQKQKQK